MKSLAIASALALAAAFTNVAAQAGDWNGPYIGVDLSHARAWDDGLAYDFAGTTPINWGQNVRPQGLGLGIRGGHGWLVGDRMVVGIEGAYGSYHASDTVFQYNQAAGNNCFPAGVCTFKTQLQQSLSLRARLGYLTSSKLMVFATAGVTRMKVARTVHDGWSSVAGDYRYDAWQQGLEWGLGLEYRLSQRFSGTLSYRSANLGRHFIATPAFGGEGERFKLRTNELSLGLNHRF